VALPEEVQLVWQRFESFIQARDARAGEACVYVPTGKRLQYEAEQRHGTCTADTEAARDGRWRPQVTAHATSGPSPSWTLRFAQPSKER
jgi:hypothetical protein